MFWKKSAPRKPEEPKTIQSFPDLIEYLEGDHADTAKKGRLMIFFTSNTEYLGVGLRNRKLTSHAARHLNRPDFDYMLRQNLEILDREARAGRTGGWHDNTYRAALAYSRLVCEGFNVGSHSHPESSVVEVAIAFLRTCEHLPAKDAYDLAVAFAPYRDYRRKRELNTAELEAFRDKLLRQFSPENFETAILVERELQYRQTMLAEVA